MNESEATMSELRNKNKLDIINHDVDLKEIPDSIFDANHAVKPKTRAKKSQKTSNFLITANPNVSQSEINSKEKITDVAKKLITFAKNLEINLKNHKLLKEYTTADYKFPNVTTI